MNNKNNSKSNNQRVVTKGVDLVKVEVPFSQRLKTLSSPHAGMTVNEIFISQLIRGLEVTKGLVGYEKAIEDSEFAKEFLGKRPVFVGDVAKVLKHEGENSTSTFLSLLNLSIVGEDVAGEVLPIKLTRSNLVAEQFGLLLDEADFQKLSGKIFLGTTIMFSANLEEVGGLFSFKNTKVLDFGLRLFEEGSDKVVDKLAILNDMVDTQNYEYFNVQGGVVTENLYRNAVLDPYILAFNSDNNERHLLDGVQYILRTLDSSYYKKLESKLVGIAKVVPTDE